MVNTPARRQCLVVGASLHVAISSSSCLANSFSVGYQNAEYTLELAESNQTIKLGGMNIFANIDISERLSVSAETYDLSNDKSIERGVNASLDASSWTLSASYSLESAYLSLQYTDIQQEEVYTVTDAIRPLESQDSDYRIYSATFGYDWTLDNWQVGSSMGVHLSDWQQMALRRPEPQNPIDVIDEDGNSTFVSLSFNLSRYHAWSQSSDLIWGTGVTWNQLIEDDLTQNISPMAPNNSANRPGPTNASLPTGTESYAQINAYIAFFFAEHWQLDANTSMDIGSDQDGQFWSVNLGYNF